MARLPDQSYLLTMYANFLISAKKDVQAARTQLQLAQKAGPGLVERYVSQPPHCCLPSELDSVLLTTVAAYNDDDEFIVHAVVATGWLAQTTPLPSWPLMCCLLCIVVPWHVCHGRSLSLWPVS